MKPPFHPNPRTLQTTAPTPGLQRRHMVRIALGAAAALGLAACGGGGGDSDDGGGGSDPKDLRAALDRLEKGMTQPEVNAAVGWEPNDSPLNWSHDGYSLQVIYRTPNDSNTRVINSARLSGRGIGITRTFY